MFRNTQYHKLKTCSSTMTLYPEIPQARAVQNWHDKMIIITSGRDRQFRHVLNLANGVITWRVFSPSRMSAHLTELKLFYDYTAKNAQVVTSLLTSCNNLFQQADIKMRSHGLRQLVDNKSVESSQRTCSKFIIKTCHNRLVASIFNILTDLLQLE